MDRGGWQATVHGLTKELGMTKRLRHDIEVIKTMCYWKKDRHIDQCMVSRKRPTQIWSRYKQKSVQRGGASKEPAKGKLSEGRSLNTPQTSRDHF